MPDSNSRASSRRAVSAAAGRFTDEEKLAECERELRCRRRVYDRAVGAGHMSAGAAERQIALMAAIADDYRSRVAPRLL